MEVIENIDQRKGGRVMLQCILFFSLEILYYKEALQEILCQFFLFAKICPFNTASIVFK